MNYFTPELIRRLNSRDDAVVEAAERAWDTARDAYERTLEKIKPSLNNNARAVLDLDLHDASRLLAEVRHDHVLLIYLRLETGEVIQLMYLLNGPITEVVHQSIANVSPPPRQPQWLYDELQLGKRMFVHSILWSDGSEWQIPFDDMKMELLKAPSPIGNVARSS